jgi:hypothetical protein
MGQFVGIGRYLGAAFLFQTGPQGLDIVIYHRGLNKNDQLIPSMISSLVFEQGT